ncbi:BrnT family toxin [Halomonas alkaliantarctica]|uniref:BrnT family toxin n=1 Tax=Halomonas alkaliantarctica TaxID=232346 RepID=UPI003D7D17B4
MISPRKQPPPLNRYSARVLWEEEGRFILLGTSVHSRLLVVCYCVRDGETIRIISARKANRRE